MSLPSWERGLKFGCNIVIPPLFQVAPLVGAWIEIIATGASAPPVRSLPSWERGLKFYVSQLNKLFDRRSPRGSVD